MRIIALLVFTVISTAARGESFSSDFAAFLAGNYPQYDFSGADAGVNSAFGGKDSADQIIHNRPVILVHGSTDRAAGGHSNGWYATINFLRDQGYNNAEIYALTWGDGNESSAIANNHAGSVVMTVRKFIEAVLRYTGANQVDIIGHSMGVTLSRRAIKGGRELGAPLTDQIRTFVGIAGANRGVGSCLNPFSDFLPTCSRTLGFHPDSAFLADLNADPAKEATFVYSIWSNADDLLNRAVIGADNPVPSQITSPIAGEDESFAFENYTHLEVRDLTVATQWEAISQ